MPFWKCCMKILIRKLDVCKLRIFLIEGNTEAFIEPAEWQNAATSRGG